MPSQKLVFLHYSIRGKLFKNAFFSLSICFGRSMFWVFFHSLKLFFEKIAQRSLETAVTFASQTLELCICLQSSSCMCTNICWWHFVFRGAVCSVPSVHLQFSNKRNLHFHATPSFRAPKTNTFFSLHLFVGVVPFPSHRVRIFWFPFVSNEKDAQMKHMLFAVLRVQHRKCIFSIMSQLPAVDVNCDRIVSLGRFVRQKQCQTYPELKSHAYTDTLRFIYRYCCSLKQPVLSAMVLAR